MLLTKGEHPNTFPPAKVPLSSHANGVLFRAGGAEGVCVCVLGVKGASVQLLRRGMESVLVFKEMEPG